jgi:chromate transporter
MTVAAFLALTRFKVGIVPVIGACGAVGLLSTLLPRVGGG